MSRPRRELVLALAGCATGAVLALVAVGRPWVDVVVRRVAATPDDDGGFLLVTRALTGREVAPGAAAWSLLALAGVVAIAATRRVGRLVTGAVVFAAGVIVAGLALRVRADPARHAETVLPPGELLTAQVSVTAWTWLAVAAGLVLAATGALVALRGRGWSTLSARYSRRPAEPAGPAGDAEMWDAIDRGDEPV